MSVKKWPKQFVHFWDFFRFLYSLKFSLVIAELSVSKLISYVRDFKTEKIRRISKQLNIADANEEIAEDDENRNCYL